MVKIEFVRYGEAKIGGKTYYSDVIVYWNGNVEMRTKSHIVSVEEMISILAKKPDYIIVGTGLKDSLLRIPENTRYLIEQAGAKLFVETTQKAVEIFNAFVKTRKKAVVIIHTSL